METEKESAPFNKTEVADWYQYLQKQPSIVVVNHWLVEFVEKKRALSFIANRGLFADYMKSREI